MKKKIFNFLLIFCLIFVSFILYEITNISLKIVNRPIISFDISNVRNPQTKKMLRNLDNAYVSILLKYHQKSKLYYINKDDRDKLPDELIIK